MAFPKAINVDKDLPVGAALGIHAVQPIADGWAAFLEVGVFTPTTKLVVQPQMIVGAIKKVNKHFLVGATGLTRWVPKKNTYAVGRAIVPIFPVSKTLKVATPVAYISYAGGVDLVSVSVRLNFKIL